MMRAAVLCAALAVAAADVQASRTVTQILAGASGKVTLDRGCSKTDQYGSNDCVLNWGQNYTASVDATLPEAIDTGAKVDVDLKLDGLIPFKFTCPVCGEGQVCEFTVPIVGQKVSLPLPPCPLVPAGAYSNSTVLPLPATSPVPISATAKGTATVTDAAGKVLLALDINAKLSPA